MSIEPECASKLNDLVEYLDCSKAVFENRLDGDKIEESSLNDFTLHRTIGVGAFGRVILVSHKVDPNKYLAMKVSQNQKLKKIF